MSVYHIFYLEYKDRDKDKWHFCLPYVKENNGFKAHCFMWGQSYLSDLAQKLKEEGDWLQSNELSEELQSIYKDGNTFITLTINELKNLIPTHYQHIEYVLKNQYIQDEDDYDGITPIEYSNLIPEVQRLYELKEWDDSYGWQCHIKELYKKVCTLIDIHEDAVGEMGDYRIVMSIE